MHNGLLADPTNKFTRRIKEICSKGSKKMTDADHEERNRLEWEGGLYWNDNAPAWKNGMGPVIPSDNIERCIQLGAQKSRLGKDVAAAVFCSVPEVQIKFRKPAGGVTRDGMYADPGFLLRKGVSVNKARIIRVRPMIPNPWQLSFDLEYDDSIINEKSLSKAMTDAGQLIGLGDWRPKFGRFLTTWHEWKGFEPSEAELSEV